MDFFFEYSLICHTHFTGGGEGGGGRGEEAIYLKIGRRRERRRVIRHDQQQDNSPARMTEKGGDGPCGICGGSAGSELRTYSTIPSLG